MEKVTRKKENSIRKKGKTNYKEESLSCKKGITA